MKSYYNSDNALGRHGCDIASRIHKFIEEIYEGESKSGYSVRELTGIIMQEATYSESHRVLVDRMAKYKGKTKQPSVHILTENSQSDGAKVIPLNPRNNPKN